MTAAVIDRSMNAKHTYSCALSTRGGVCDCWPEQAGFVRHHSTDHGYSDAAVDPLERCAMCGRTLNGSAHEIVDLDGIDQLCEHCFLQAEQEQLSAVI